MATELIAEAKKFAQSNAYWRREGFEPSRFKGYTMSARAKNRLEPP
jgi:hypothetical protein